MVWYRKLELPVVPTRWAILGVALGGAPVWPCGGGAGLTEESVGRRPLCYLFTYRILYGNIKLLIYSIKKRSDRNWKAKIGRDIL